MKHRLITGILMISLFCFLVGCSCGPMGDQNNNGTNVTDDQNGINSVTPTPNGTQNGLGTTEDNSNVNSVTNGDQNGNGGVINDLGEDVGEGIKDVGDAIGNGVEDITGNGSRMH